MLERRERLNPAELPVSSCLTISEELSGFPPIGGNKTIIFLVSDLSINHISLAIFSTFAYSLEDL